MQKDGLRDLSACGASLCCMWLSIQFLDNWVRVVVHRHGIIWTFSITVKPQAAIDYDPWGYYAVKL